MLKLNIAADLGPLKRSLKEFQKEQLPFATALALTRLAQGVVAQERDEIKKTFDSPTPFTLNSITLRSATKSNLTAIVYPKQIAEAYLEPYVVGGNRSLGTKAGMLVPKGTAVNRYGNLSKNKLKQLKSKKDVFIGTVRFRGSGQTVSGVWQRGFTKRGPREKGGGEYGTRGNSQNKIGGVRTTLKLLIRFSDTTEVPRRLPFDQAAREYLKANTQRELDKAIREALRTARQK